MAPQGPPAGATGPPPGFVPPSGANGPPAGIGGGPPTGQSGAPNGAGQFAAHKFPLTTHDVHTTIGVTTMLLTLCLAAVGGRLAARRIVKTSIGYDDYAAIIAFVRRVIHHDQTTTIDSSVYRLST